MFQLEVVVVKIKTHISHSITFPRKLRPLWDNMEEYDRAREATDDNTIRRMRFACWITKATDTHSQYVPIIAFQRQQSISEDFSKLHLYAYCLPNTFYIFPQYVQIFNTLNFTCLHSFNLFAKQKTYYLWREQKTPSIRRHHIPKI
jgi:hypothetical protein